MNTYFVMLVTDGIAVICLELKIGHSQRTVSLVCGIKCHCTSALLALAVQLFPSGQYYIGFCWRKLRKGDHLGQLGVDVEIIFRWVYKKWVWEFGVERTGLRYGQMAGTR